jgi:hypothetical protein
MGYCMPGDVEKQGGENYKKTKQRRVSGRKPPIW